jgi:hypothetical protein
MGETREIELWWGKDSDHLVVGSSEAFPEDLLAEIQDHDIRPADVTITDEGAQYIEYNLSDIHTGAQTPLDFVGETIVGPLRERKIGKVVFYPVLQRPEDGLLFPK